MRQCGEPVDAIRACARHADARPHCLGSVGIGRHACEGDFGAVMQGWAQEQPDGKVLDRESGDDDAIRDGEGVVGDDGLDRDPRRCRRSGGCARLTDHDR